jgi:hypothetical protein
MVTGALGSAALVLTSLGSVTAHVTVRHARQDLAGPC